MDTPIDSLAGQDFARQFPPDSPLANAQETEPSVAPPPRPIDPDDPPWSAGAAVLVWLGSIGLLVLTQFLAVLIYVGYRAATGGSLDGLQETAQLDPALILISTVMVAPAHALTFVLAWWLITGSGKRPFKETIGWSWSRRVGLWTSAGLAVALLAASGLIAELVGGGETDIEKIITSSTAARFAIAVLATATAPLIEEIIYRGVLFPAVQRSLNTTAAVGIVSFLFASVHLYQYRTSPGVIVAISLLSVSLTLVRARTGKLLPCFVIHFIFNGIQSLVIAFGPYFQSSAEKQIPSPGFIWRWLTHAAQFPF